MIKAGQNYKGLLVRGASYTLLSVGIDHYCLRVRGKAVYVPFWIEEVDEAQLAAEREREYNE